MSEKLLEPSARQALLLRHKRTRDRREADRIKAVLLRDDDWTYAAIAEALFLTEEGVRQHIKDYAASGKLKPENGGSSQMLGEEQTKELLAHLDEKIYVKVSAICAYAQEKFSVRYSVRGMTDLIKRHGFSFHQPCGRPAKADAEAQAEFVERYEKIKANLGDEDQILFMDGVHPSHAVRFVSGWIRKGERKEIPTNAGQRRMNVLGALDLAEMKILTQEYATLNSEAVIAFLTFLLTMIPRGFIHIVLDQGRYQKCLAVAEWAALNPRIKLHYLPPYSPNLNAIERCWKLMHEHTTDNEYYPTFKEFTEKIREFFRDVFPKNARNWIDTLNDVFKIVGTKAHA